jgi:hypothetical protein
MSTEWLLTVDGVCGLGVEPTLWERRIAKAPISPATIIIPIKATPPTTPPTIAPTFNSLLVTATEVGVEETELEVEATEVGIEVVIGVVEMPVVDAEVEATEVGVEVAIGVVEMPVVDAGTGDDSEPPETKISECRPIGRRTNLHS